MEWVNQWDFSNNPTTHTTEEVMRRELAAAHSSGELEELRTRVDNLTQCLSKVVAALPEHAQKEIVELVGYGWKLKGE